MKINQINLNQEIDKFENQLIKNLDRPLPNYVHFLRKLLLYAPFRYGIYWVLFQLLDGATSKIIFFGKVWIYKINIPDSYILVLALILTACVIVFKLWRKKKEIKGIVAEKKLIQQDLENKAYSLLVRVVENPDRKLHSDHDGGESYYTYHYSLAFESLAKIENSVLQPPFKEDYVLMEGIKNSTQHTVNEKQFQNIQEGHKVYNLVGLSSGYHGGFIESIKNLDTAFEKQE